jgi:uncharacterized protein (DUF2141 family)
MLINKIILVLVITTSTKLFAQTRSQLLIKVSNIQLEKANIRIALYNNAESFTSETKMYLSNEIKTSTSKDLLISFDEIPYGTYAIALYQDKNNNKKLDLNFVGYPKEPFGFSNNFKPLLSSPSFSDCAFVFSKANSTISIKLIN